MWSIRLIHATLFLILGARAASNVDNTRTGEFYWSINNRSYDRSGRSFSIRRYLSSSQNLPISFYLKKIASSEILFDYFKPFYKYSNYEIFFCYTISLESATLGDTETISRVQSTLFILTAFFYFPFLFLHDVLFAIRARLFIMRSWFLPEIVCEICSVVCWWGKKQKI